MKFFLSIIITASISFIVGLYTPWWSIAIVAFIISLLIKQQPVSAFLSGFIGVFALWCMIASFINAANNSILANRVGGLLGIGHNSTMLIIITSFVGALVAGFAALSASYLYKKK